MGVLTKKKEILKVDRWPPGRSVDARENDDSSRRCLSFCASHKMAVKNKGTRTQDEHGNGLEGQMSRFSRRKQRRGSVVELLQAPEIRNYEVFSSVRCVTCTGLSLPRW